eukprot:14589585-Ditylum_brightwellii.AAC.1
MSIILEDETSECQCKVVLKMIGTAGQRLEQWKEVVGTMYHCELTSEYEHNNLNLTAHSVQPVDLSPVSEG